MRILVFLSLFVVLQVTRAQSPCGTSISFLNPPSDPICTSIWSDIKLQADPPGGVFSGPSFIDSRGQFNPVQARQGDYWVYYQAADSCDTRDSILVSFVGTETEFYQATGSFDCTTSQGGTLEYLTGPSDLMIITQAQGVLATVRPQTFGRIPLASGADVTLEIITSSGTCRSIVPVATTNEPQVTASVDYVCADNRAYLQYSGPSNPQSVVWRRFDQQPNDLGSPFRPGGRIPVLDTGNYNMKVTFSNGCQARDQVRAPFGFGIVPGANAGSYAPLACDTHPSDSIFLLANAPVFGQGYSWSMPDGTRFPGDSTQQRPRVPGVAAGYVLRTVNTFSGCFSAPDTAEIRLGAPDTVVILEYVCQQPIRRQERSAGTSSRVEFLPADSTGCDTIVVIQQVPVPAPELTFWVSNPDPDGLYDVSSTTTGGTPPYAPQWSTGSTIDELIGVPPGTYTLTVTDANGCSTTGTVVVGVSSVVHAVPGTFQLSPNPVTSDLHWSYEGPATLVDLRVRSLTGQEVLAVGGSSHRLALGYLPAGMYLLEWRDDQGRRAVRKVVRS